MQACPIPDMTGPSTRSWLREATRGLHEDAEAMWMPAAAFRSKDSYRGFLSALLQAHARLGLPAARRRGDTAAQLSEQARIDALCRDLQHRLPRQHPPQKMSALYAWGVSYVLNGSTLGASLLISKGYLEASWPRSYLETSRAFAKSGQLRSFFDQLDDLPMGAPELLRGAVETFEIIKTGAPPPERMPASVLREQRA